MPWITLMYPFEITLIATKFLDHFYFSFFKCYFPLNVGSRPYIWVRKYCIEYSMSCWKFKYFNNGLFLTSFLIIRLLFMTYILTLKRNAYFHVERVNRLQLKYLLWHTVTSCTAGLYRHNVVMSQSYLTLPNHSQYAL